MSEIHDCSFPDQDCDVLPQLGPPFGAVMADRKPDAPREQCLRDQHGQSITDVVLTDEREAEIRQLFRDEGKTQPTVVSAIETLAIFAIDDVLAELDRLRQQVAQLEAERDAAIREIGQIEALRDEDWERANDLQSQLAEAQARIKELGGL